MLEGFQIGGVEGYELSRYELGSLASNPSYTRYHLKNANLEEKKGEGGE